MNKEIAIDRLQRFLDKSSHHKWKEIQEAIDFLKEDKPFVESNYKTWEQGYKAGKNDRKN
jgi:hypothetical protein